MNFYFLCLVALITLISVKDVLNLSNTVVLVIGSLVLIGMVLYKTNIEMFSLSFRARKAIHDSLKTAEIQRKESEKTREKIIKLENNFKVLKALKKK